MYVLTLYYFLNNAVSCAEQKHGVHRNVDAKMDEYQRCG